MKGFALHFATVGSLSHFLFYVCKFITYIIYSYSNIKILSRKTYLSFTPKLNTYHCDFEMYVKKICVFC